MENEKTMDLKQKVKVWNRADGSITYSIDELRIRRHWAKPGDMHMVSLEELQTLQYTPGGRKILKNYLLIKDQNVCEFLGLPTDPEYFYDENDVKVLLTTGSEDQLLDCLEFAPAGVLDLIKKVAVDIKLDSAKKREIISEHLKISIDAMIRNNEASKEEATNVEDAVTPERKRRSNPVNSSKYNVVSRG